MSYIQRYINEISDILHRLPQETIAQIIQTLEQARMDHKKIFLIGNGGSAATASHFANDLIKSTIVEGKPRIESDCVDR